MRSGLANSPKCSLWFHSWMFLMSAHSPVPLKIFVLCSPLGLSIMPLLGGDFFHLRPLSSARPGCQYQPWSKVDIQGQLFHPIQWVKDGGWDDLRAYPGFRICWFIPSLPTELISSQPPLYGGFFPVCTHEEGVSLVKFRVVNLRADGYKVLGSENSAGCILVRNHLHTHARMMPCHAQAHTALAGNAHHLSEDKSPLRGFNGTLSSTCPGTTKSSFPRFLYIIDTLN